MIESRSVYFGNGSILHDHEKSSMDQTQEKKNEKLWQSLSTEIFQTALKIDLILEVLDLPVNPYTSQRFQASPRIQQSSFFSLFTPLYNPSLFEYLSFM